MRVAQWTGGLIVALLIGGGVLSAPPVEATTPSSQCGPPLSEVPSIPAPAPNVYSGGLADGRHAALDMDDDGTTDTVIFDAANHRYLITRADGVLTVDVGIGWKPGDLQVNGADLDGDGRDELVITTPINRSEPDGWFATNSIWRGTIPVGSDAPPDLVFDGMLVSDLTGDGLPDLFNQHIAGITTEVVSGVEALAAGDPFAPGNDLVVQWADVDGDGRLDLLYEGSIDGTVAPHVVFSSSGASVDVPGYNRASGEVLLFQRGHDGRIYVSVLANSPRYFLIGFPCSGPWADALATDLFGRPATPAEKQAVADQLGAGQSRLFVAHGFSLEPAYVHRVVTDLYQETLARAPDPGGLAYWTGELTSHRRTVAQVSANFYASPERYATAGGTDSMWVTVLYQSLLRRAPDDDGLRYWLVQTAAQGRVRMALRLLQSSESAHDRVAVLYQALLHRAPDPGGHDYWAARVVVDGDLALAANLIASPEYYLATQTRFP